MNTKTEIVKVRSKRVLSRRLRITLFGTLVLSTLVGGVVVTPMLKETDYLERASMSSKQGKEIIKAGNDKDIESRFTSLDESELMEGIEYDNATTEVINVEGVSYEKTLNFKQTSMRIYLDENGTLVQGIAFRLDKISNEDLEIIKLILKRCMDNSQQVVDLSLATLDKFKKKVEPVEKGVKSVETYKLGDAPTSITITPEYTVNGAYKSGIIQIFDTYSSEQPLNAEK